MFFQLFNKMKADETNNQHTATAISTANLAKVLASIQVGYEHKRQNACLLIAEAMCLQIIGVLEPVA